MKTAPNQRQWHLNKFEALAFHRNQLSETNPADTIDDRVWSDLELEKIFGQLDLGVTPLGAQYLYKSLRRYENDRTQLLENARAWQAFRSSPAATEDLRNALAKLNCEEAALLTDFLLGEPAELPKSYRLFHLCSALAILCPFGIIISPWFLVVSVAFWILNIVLHYRFGVRMVECSSVLKCIALLVGAAPGVLGAIRSLPLPEVAQLQARMDVAQRVGQRISKALLRSYGADEFTAIIIEYLNLFCLFQLNACCRAMFVVSQTRAELVEISRIIARLDAFQGLALGLVQYPAFCVPEFEPGRQFFLEDVYHPLIPDAVSNTINGAGKSVLLTGTNMAGKTTFIKTLALNLILGQTLGFCLAKRAVLPPARVRTLIDRIDTITSGQSYFFSEACELRQILRDAENNGREFWFVLDEVFRGTNSIERVAAGGAVLGRMNEVGIVIASTHDYQLAELLEERFDPYHFSESLDGKELKSDFRLRKGPCTTRNAIKLLAAAGFSKDVICRAEELVAQLDESSLKRENRAPLPSIQDLRE